MRLEVEGSQGEVDIKRRVGTIRGDGKSRRGGERIRVMVRGRHG